MTITYSITKFDTGTNNASSPIATASISVVANDIITHSILFAEPNSAGVITITNSGSALTWNPIADTGDDVNNNTRAVSYWAKASTSENITITTSWDSTNALEVETYSICHSGAHQTTPVPAGNVFSGKSSASKSQSITPTASGSALWMLVGDIAYPSTFAAGGNCTLELVADPPDNHSVSMVRPTTQPRTDANAFTLAETHTGSAGTWLAFEVVAAGGSTQAPRSMQILRRR